jgi:hypothetical protein
MEKKDTPAMKQALLELFDTDVSKVMKALAKVKRDGRAVHFPVLMDLYVKTADGPVKEALNTMLQETKLEGADEVLVGLLEAERFKEHQAFILTCIWNSGYQPIEYLDVIVKAGLGGDYMTAFEVLTILEHLEPPFDMDVLTVAHLDITDHLDTNEPNEKTAILHQIKDLLEQMKTNILEGPVEGDME